MTPKNHPPLPPEPETTLVLRTCDADMHARSPVDLHIKWDFVWPRSGPVEAPDWDPSPSCGHGLHGLAWGEGDWRLLSNADDAVWMVVAVPTVEIVKIGTDKIKFRRGEVVFCGSRVEATIRVLCGSEAMARAKGAAERWQRDRPNATPSASSGDGSTSASSGAGSTSASSGNYSTSASSGIGSTSASSGDGSKSASSGDGSTSASSGYGSTSASSGIGSTSTSSGNYSKSTSSGDGSTSASSGIGSTSTSSGNYSKSASSGLGSTSASSGDGTVAATLGDKGHAKVGPNGLVIVTYWVAEEKRYRACVGNVGEDGILADTWYRVEGGKLVVV